MKFEWDENKNSINIKKHKVSFYDAILCFTDSNALSIFDKTHSETEERWITLGLSKSNIFVVVHTEKIDDTIRIISARKATKSETITYYKRSKK